MAVLREATAFERAVTVGAFGLAVASALAWFAPWQLTVLGGWDAAAAAFLVWVGTTVRAMDPEATAAHSTREDNSRATVEIALVVAAVVSLAGVGALLVKAGPASGAEKIGLTVGAVATVALSWAVVHTLFTLRYAHLYYGDEPGGIDFKTDRERPDYRDFAYVAFTVGMTFQVSDTDIQARAIRRTVLRQALLSYLFGAVIVAVVVNVVAGLIS